jgi:hypothetical protein
MLSSQDVLELGAPQSTATSGRVQSRDGVPLILEKAARTRPSDPPTRLLIFKVDEIDAVIERLKLFATTEARFDRAHRP